MFITVSNMVDLRKIFICCRNSTTYGFQYKLDTRQSFISVNLSLPSMYRGIYVSQAEIRFKIWQPLKIEMYKYRIYSFMACIFMGFINLTQFIFMCINGCVQLECAMRKDLICYFYLICHQIMLQDTLYFCCVYTSPYIN